MTRTLDARARLLLLVLLLVLAAGVAGFMAVTRMHGSSDSEPAPAPAPAPVTHTPNAAAATPAAKPHSASSAKPHAAPAQHRAVAKAAAKPKPASSPNQLPAAIRRALAADQVVVVALYDPRAKIDGTALAEARAGAKLAGSSFVPIDVRRRGVDSLNAKYGAVHDPAVLVLRPPESLVVRIDGFADRDTVAQAAMNAAS